MDFSLTNARAQKIWFDEDNLWILLVDGRQLSVPKVCFSKLNAAKDEELLDYELSGGGLGIHWDALDEDLYVPNLLMGITSVQKSDYSA